MSVARVFTAQRDDAQIAGLFRQRNRFAEQPQAVVRFSDGLQQVGFGEGIVGELVL